MNKIEQAAELMKQDPNITIKQIAKKLSVKVSYAYAIRSKAHAWVEEQERTSKQLFDERMSQRLLEAVTTGRVKARMEAGGLVKVEAAEALNTSPLAVQVGGEHYKNMAIQPIQFITANNLGFLEGCIVKRISRWRSKDGIQDLQKIKHEVDLLIAANS